MRVKVAAIAVFLLLPLAASAQQRSLYSWVDDDGVIGRVTRFRHLDQAELRPVGALAHELGIDGDEGRLGVFPGQPGEVVCGGDYLHGASL